MNANSKKVMEKLEKNSGAATKEESLGGTKEAPKSVAAAIEESSGGSKEAPKTVVATIEESTGGSKEEPKSVVATIEESSGGTKEAPKTVMATIEESSGGSKEAPKTVVATIEESSGGSKEAPKTVVATIEESSGGSKEAPKSMAAPIEEPSVGTEEAPKKSTVEPLKEIVLKNTTPENKLLKAEPKAKSDVDVESIAGTSAKPKSKDENSSGKKELATTSATGLKRTRDNSSEKNECQDTNENFEEKSRQKVQTMTRQELEDLAVQKIIEEKKANREVKRIRTQLMKTEDTGSMCPKCKTTVRPARPVYASTVTKEKGQGSRGSNQSGRSGGKAGKGDGQSQSGPVGK